MADEDVIQSGRNDKGEFVSKQAVMQAAQRALQRQNLETEKARAKVDSLTGAWRKQEKHVKKLASIQAKAFRTQIKDLGKVQKTVEKSMKAQVKATQRAMTSQVKEYRKLARERVRAARGGRGGLGVGGGGIGAGVGPIIGIGALVAALKGLSSYVQDLAWGRQYARALSGPRDITPQLGNQRDVALYTQFAQQGFANRFAAPTEISGLKSIRDVLQKQLGEEAGTALTLKLTESLKGSRAELSQFLAMASQDVPRALSVFQSADIDNFSTALGAVNSKTDELSKTAFTLEQAWRDVKDSFEQFVKDFVEKNGVDLRQTVQQIAQGIVDAINWGRQWSAEWKPVFEFILGGLKMIRDAIKGTSYIKDLLNAGQTQVQVRVIDSQLDPLLKKQREARDKGDMKTVARLKKPIQKLLRLRSQIVEGQLDEFRDTDYKLPTLRAAEQAEKFTLNMGKAVEATKQEGKELEQMLTPIQRATLEIGKVNELLEESNARIKRDMSRLNMLQSSPLGFGRQQQATLDVVTEMNAEIDLLNRKLQEQQAIVAENEKNGRDARADRIKALEIESQINDRMAERNKLLVNMERGYLDAIGAMALGAGKFEKFIITQERNVGRGLRMGMVKRNPLIGSVDLPKAPQLPIQPFRYGTDMDANIQGAMDYERQIRRQFKQHVPPPMIAPPKPRQLQDIQGARTMQSPHGLNRPAPEQSGDKGSSNTTIKNPGWKTADKLIEGAALIGEAGKEMKTDSQPQRYRSGRYSAI